MSYRLISFLMIRFHFFLLQIYESAFIKTPFSRQFFNFSHNNLNSVAVISMTQVSSIRPLRWLAFLRNYPSFIPLPPTIPKSLNTTNIFLYCAIALPLKWMSFTLNSGNNYGLRIHEVGASNHLSPAEVLNVSERRFSEHLSKFSCQHVSLSSSRVLWFHCRPAYRNSRVIIELSRTANAVPQDWQRPDNWDRDQEHTSWREGRVGISRDYVLDEGACRHSGCSSMFPFVFASQLSDSILRSSAHLQHWNFNCRCIPWPSHNFCWFLVATGIS